MMGVIFKFISLLAVDLIRWIKGDEELRAVRYLRLARAGKIITSRKAQSQQIAVYPGASVSLPTGDYIVLRDSDVSLENRIISDLKMIGDPAKTFMDAFTHSFIWIYDKYDVFNCIQLTAVNMGDYPPISSETIIETQTNLREHFRQTEPLKSFSLELEQLNLPNWKEACVVQRKELWSGEGGTKHLSIVIQDRPVEVIISVDCSPKVYERYAEKVVQIAHSYNKISNL